MQIPHSNQELFPPVQPAAASQIKQDNAQRPLIEPVSEAESSSTRQSATDSFTPSEQANSTELYNRQGQASSPEKAPAQDADNSAANATPATDDTDTPKADSSSAAADKELTLEQQEELLQLQQRDQEVRVHEQQHASVGGQHTGAPSYDYKTGPDGKQYAVEGSVSVDISPIAGDPNATIEKMRQVKAAALAPAEPSSADKNTAARADAYIAQATATLAQENKLSTADKPEADKAATSGSTASADTVKSQTDIATDTPTAKDANGQMKHRNQVIAGVYGQAAKAQSQQLLSLA